MTIQCTCIEDTMVFVLILIMDNNPKKSVKNYFFCTDDFDLTSKFLGIGVTDLGAPILSVCRITDGHFRVCNLGQRMRKG